MVSQSLTVEDLWSQRWQLPITTLLLVMLPLLSILFLATRRRRSTSSNNLPPGPSRLPILGNLHQMRGLPHRSLWELARRHGPVMMLRLGTVPTVVVSSAEAARDVFQTHDAGHAGARRLSYEHSDVSFSPYSEQWRERRKLLVFEFLSKRRIQQTWYAREAEVEKLISRLTSVGRKPVSLEDHIFGCMDGIIGTVAFGNIYGAGHFEYKEHFHHVIEDAMAVRSSFCAEDYFPNALGRLVDRLTGVASFRERVFTEFDTFFELILEQHLGGDPSGASNKPNNGGGLVNVLVGLMNERQGSLRVNRDVIKGILTNTFIGAVDTGSVTIVWAMVELVRNPGVLRKVQEEIRATVGNKERVQPDDVPKLKYLKMVVMETLRLHPAFPLLVPRETLRSIKVSGYDVPAKTRIFVNAWAIGRDPAKWERPEAFVPERFEGEDAVSFSFNRAAQLEFVPFGAGRRMCPGKDMAVATTEFMLANLLHCFDWELPEGTGSEDVSMDEAGGLTVHKKTPLLLVPTRYRSASAMAE